MSAHYVYSQLVTCMVVYFAMAGVMTILVEYAFLSIVAMYWFYKMLVFKFYSKP